MTAILVTGANGFIGVSLCHDLVLRAYKVKGATRLATVLGGNVENCLVKTLDETTDWSGALQNIEVVVHLAARVHVMRDSSSNPLDEFRRTNVAGTENLARQAALAGVRRLVYVSSIKVNGEEQAGERAYSELDVAAPQDPYGISKWEAEQALHQVAQETGLEVVVVRPPLVYGAGVKGNFIQMMRMVARGIPLPLGIVNNQRDLIYVGNLVDALIICATHPSAAGQTYLVRDGESVSTTELLQRLAHVLDVPARLIPAPASLLRLAGRLSGKSAQIGRLLGSLRVDDAKIRRELGWTPPYSLQQGLRATATWYNSIKL